ncbi:MAG TPA: hypothetical protein VJ508_01740 [Saprospiraceae bacterium]|nr:hypothetical protein [Saprospiraceae bacterium]
MAKVHERIAEFQLTLNAAADTLQVTALNYYRTEAELAAANPFVMTANPLSAQTSPAEILLGENLPPPTKIRFVFAAF